MYYHDIRTGVTDNLTAYVNSDYAYKRFEYDQVVYTSSNLYKFVQITIPSYSTYQLVYDTNTLFWTWGKYQMINLTYADPYFSQILALINGG